MKKGEREKEVLRERWEKGERREEGNIRQSKTKIYEGEEKWEIEKQREKNLKHNIKYVGHRAMIEHVCNSSTWELEAGGH